ncbi:MAG: hypothetical protein AB1391_01205 [Candidatus Micrarchaeota archaeon]
MEPIVISDSKAIELFRRYGAGIMENEKIKIHPIEALYFIERGKLTLENETFDSLLAKIKNEDALAEEKYAVLKHLRQNGYILRVSFLNEPWMRVYRKGFRPGEDRTQYLLKIVSNTWHPKLKELIDDIKKAAQVRKELIYVLVQKEKPSFFKVTKFSFF